MDVKLLCARCQTPLVPSWSGQRCPRMTACGRGGYVESLAAPAVALPFSSLGAGVRA